MIQLFYKSNHKSKFCQFFFNIKTIYQRMKKNQFLWTRQKSTRIVHNPSVLTCLIVEVGIIWRVGFFPQIFKIG